MRNFLIQLLVALLIFSGSISYGFANSEPPTSSCKIDDQTIQIGDRAVSYSQVGKGQPILLLHGLFANKEQWHSLMCRLSEMGYRTGPSELRFALIAPDLPGYGNSRNFPLKDYALENQAILLHELMQKLGVQSVDVAGNSMGGAIAQIYAQRYPTEVRSVAFIGAPLGIVDWSPSVKAAILKGTNPFIPITKEEFELEIGLLFVNPPAIPDSVIAETVNDYKTRNRQYQQIWDIVNLYDESLCQGNPTQLPTLTIWGKQDKIYDLSGVKRLKKCVTNSQVVELAQAGHLPMVENASEVASSYGAFLKAAR